MLLRVFLQIQLPILCHCCSGICYLPTHKLNNNYHIEITDCFTGFLFIHKSMIIMYKSVLRRLSTSVASKEPLHNVKPFSEVPSPQGRLPFLGHMLTYRRNTENISKSEYKMGLFNKLGPIFKLDFPRGNNYSIG